MGEDIKELFPLLVERNDLTYLDSAATSQKPVDVIAALQNFYSKNNANVHRAVYDLASDATADYEKSRAQVASFINAASVNEVVFVRGATEAINLVAQSWGQDNLSAGDEILLSVMEHHANLVPWQMVARKTGAKLRFVKLDENQCYDMASFHEQLSPRTRLVALSHVSNVLGCINPVEEVVEAAHGVGARVLVDACQSVPHMPVDVQAIGADWLVASGHKMCAPTGIGFLHGKEELLNSMYPWQGGGDMIDQVGLYESTYLPSPQRFEAGTPAIGEAIGLGAACEFLCTVGMDRVHEHETRLASYLYKRLASVEGVDVYGPSPDVAERAALAAFNVKGGHSYDLATLLGMEGVAVRSGHHCAQPLHKELGVTHSARASLYLYNTEKDVDVLVAKLQDAMAMLGAG